MIKYLNFWLLAVTALCLSYVSYGQHGLNYNQFQQLRNSFNNSLSLMDPDGGAALMGRLQWVGIDGAPQTYQVGGHVGIKQLKMTVGLDIKQASIGVVRNRELSGYVASAVRLSENDYLGISLGGGLSMQAGNFSELDMTDPSFRDDTRYNRGMVSVSTSYFRENRYYIGVSIPRFVLNTRESDLDYDLRRVYCLTGGALFRVDDGFHIRPSFVVSHVENMDLGYDVNVVTFFAQKFGVGVGLQNQGNMSGLLQFNFGDLGVGYGYQFNVGSGTIHQSVSNNTHEISLRYRVGGMKML